MIKPINKQVLVSPMEHESFISSTKQTYDEVGEVIELDPNLENLVGKNGLGGVCKGAKVYFDSWQASKFPTGNDGEFHWLVPFESIKAYEVSS